MAGVKRSNFRKKLHQSLRRLINFLPTPSRFAIYRRLIDCDPAPDARLELKIADTQEELEACFRILHDAYVSSGFMKPDPSGMRVTIYHALPTTTTLCAKYGGVVVGTMSMIREGVFGFPLQSVFDLTHIRAQEGNIAEISALAVHPDYRKTGGAILFPLMKFMYQYCTEYFDTRHLVIAVNPDKIELYESLLFFKRLQQNVVDNYDFANGAPAVGATLDLKNAAGIFEGVYGRRAPRKNLHNYFVRVRLPNIQLPKRRYFTTNDPVMTPTILDHFFNRATRVFDALDERKRMLLHSIYDGTAYADFLPALRHAAVQGHPLRRHQRYSIRCPATLEFATVSGVQRFEVHVIEMSLGGFQAECKQALPLNVQGTATIELGKHETSRVSVVALRRKGTEFGEYYGFRLDAPDVVWQHCVAALEHGQTSEDLMLQAA
jgi:GNAT superfamily N-acetyltransferase